MGPITRTCKLALALALGGIASTANARVEFLRSGASTFVAARAAADAGDARRAAMLYASLAAADPTDRMVAGRALSQAILGGDMPLALRLAKGQPRTDLPVDARMLLAADALRSGRARKEGIDWPPELGFVKPFVEAWTLSERGRWSDAVKTLDEKAAADFSPSLVAEHKALILLAAGRTREAQPFFEPALASAKGRATRLRIAFASGLLARGEREAGFALLAGNDPALRTAAASLASERRPRPVVATAAQGFSELLTALALGLGEDESRSLPLALVQVARFADPQSEQAALFAGLLLDRGGRSDEATAVLRTVPENSPFLSDARDAEVRALIDADRKQEALARAKSFVGREGEQAATDWVRLGDALDAMQRHVDAATAYGGAAAAVQAGGAGPEAWSIHLLRGAALDQAGMWPQAESALELAYKLAPENAAVLNYLGYARLERGEQLDEAEALIAEASRRAPDDASITDSLGWAQFKRGKVADAIATLQRAAAADPAQSEINEHLGDALYTAGRRYEARFAWNAALVTAEDDIAKRISAKIATGLSPTNAAP